MNKSAVAQAKNRKPPRKRRFSCFSMSFWDKITYYFAFSAKFFRFFAKNIAKSLTFMLYSCIIQTYIFSVAGAHF